MKIIITIKISRKFFFCFWHWIHNSKVIVFQNQNATKLAGVSCNHPPKRPKIVVYACCFGQNYLEIFCSRNVDLDNGIFF